MLLRISSLLICLILSPFCSALSDSNINTVDPKSSEASAVLFPLYGVYFGVYLDWLNDNAAAYKERLGISPSVYVAFFSLPFDEDELKRLNSFIDQVAQQRGYALLTLEPHQGLDIMTPRFASELAGRIARYNARGVPIFLRFAHEMNGYWYPWSQKPVEYVYAFRTLASEIHKQAPRTAMLWAPSIGGSYPPENNRYLANSGSYNFKLLDTNEDGRLDLQDDMYAPFYPGDDAVDWVGMSVYHWGLSYPWGENELPEPKSFINRITGNYVGMNGDERAVPDFYQEYVINRGKPMAVTETAALYNPAVDGENEFDIKQTWWRQVFSSEIKNNYPGIKMINWFETRKYETEINGYVDWSVTFNPELREKFRNELPVNWLLYSSY